MEESRGNCVMQMHIRNQPLQFASICIQVRWLDILTVSKENSGPMCNSFATSGAYLKRNSKELENPPQKSHNLNQQPDLHLSSPEVKQFLEIKSITNFRHGGY